MEINGFFTALLHSVVGNQNDFAELMLIFCLQLSSDDSDLAWVI